ncbi:MAG: hypothetical protein K2Q12_00360 [Rickettsiales bacterium]|nr:hypothetical protein [Rickettsiales bacterium]
MYKKEEWVLHLNALHIAGNDLLSQSYKNDFGSKRFRENSQQEGLEWIWKAFNALDQVCPKGNILQKRLYQIQEEDSHDKDILKVDTVEKLTALCRTVSCELSENRLLRIEYEITATNFDDFLDHAKHYHKGGKKTEAAVIASAIFEDTIKKIAMKNELSATGSLEEILHRLMENGIINSIKKKRLQSHADLRNHALHAEWNKFEIREVGLLIEEVRKLLDEYLS